MTRAEKASDATLDEILASIRRIIAEEPSGARPLPVTKPKSPSLSGEPQRAGARPQNAVDEFGPQLSSLRPGAASAPQTAAAPAQRPAAPDVSARQRRLDEPPMPELSMGNAPAARGPSAPAPLVSVLGCLVWGWGCFCFVFFFFFPEVSLPPISKAAPEVIEATPFPSPAPAPADPFPSMRGAVDDLSDLLDDVAPPPSAPVAAEPAAMPAPVFAMPPEVIAPPADAVRRDTAPPRTIARRTVDLGAIVPGRDEPVADAAIVVETPVETPVEPVATGAGSRSSAQSRAMDKMLSARIASASVKHPAPPPEPTGPVVIAAMPDPAAVEPAGSAEDEIASPGGDAASALDMRAAGLAQAAPAQAAPAPAERAPADAPAAPVAPEPRAAEAAVTPSKPLEPPLPPAPVAEANPAPARPVVSSAAPSLPLAAAPPAAAAVPPPAAPPIAPVPAPVASASQAAGTQVPATLPPVVGVRTIEDMVAELLRPMLREWLAENMPRMVEKALRIELAEGLKTVNHEPRKVADK